MRWISCSFYQTGDGNIMISDCSTGQTIGQLKGHSGHVMAVYADSDDIIASGSADNTVRLWDLRSQRCIDAIATGDSCVASVCVNSSGNMLASGKWHKSFVWCTIFGERV